MNIQVDKFTKEDAENIRELAMKTPELWDSEEAGYLSIAEIKTLTESPDDVYLKATVDGNFAGFTIITYNKYIKGAYMMDIAIKEEYRNLGIFKLLSKESEKILKEKGCNWIWALVYEKNTRMQQILEKKGFLRGRKWFTFFKDM